MPPNNTMGLAGRLCNHIIRNLYVSFIAEYNDLAVQYSYEKEIDRLGIRLFKSGTKTYETTIIIRDEDCNTYLDTHFSCNIFVDWLAAQNHDFALRLFHHFRYALVKQEIQAANYYKERYNKNNDVFVHVRLDDAAQWNPGFAYYDLALQTIGVESGFISSDSPYHPFVSILASKYNLQLVETNEVETIMLASTCRHLVLSHGTFSWIIGALAFDASTVYIPPKSYGSWCGDIFTMPGWKIIEA
jgi:hypothetical protein